MQTGKILGASLEQLQLEIGIGSQLLNHHLISMVTLLPMDGRPTYGNLSPTKTCVMTRRTSHSYFAV
jgi:hypothetical protein